MTYYMRLSLYVGIVCLFWTLSAFIINHEAEFKPVNDKNTSKRSPKSEIKQAFLHGWQGYKTYAWGSDEVCSLSGTGLNWTHMGSTIVDSLSTMWLMGLHDEFKEGRDWVKTMKFDRSEDFVSYFEVNIRILGGLLSAFELSKDSVFLEKADELGKLMVKNLEISNLPEPFWSFKLRKGKGRQELRFITNYGPIYGKGHLALSEIGTLIMEFSALAYWTNNTEYAAAVERVENQVLELNSKGLKPNKIYDEPTWGNSHSVAGEADSYYEYLLKQYIHMPNKYAYLKPEALLAINEILEKLVQQDVSGFYHFGHLHKEKFIPQMDHLACFFPGLLILAILKAEPANSEYLLVMSKELVYTCYSIYEQSPTGLPPETISVSFGIKYPWLIDTHYALRPETLESLFYLYYYTKDQKYQEWALNIFDSIQTHCRNHIAYAQVSNVNKVPPSQTGCLPSYFFSETLKYLYLIFEDHDFDLSKFVFNTEGHPFIIKHDVA